MSREGLHGVNSARGDSSVMGKGVLAGQKMQTAEFLNTPGDAVFLSMLSPMLFIAASGMNITTLINT